MPQSVQTVGPGSLTAVPVQAAMLLLCTLLPAALSVALLRLRQSRVHRAAHISGLARQLSAGLLFGAAAIAATVLGPEIDGAVLNVRTAEPLCAGLIFGGPAGILAGLIGGVYRYAAGFWGVGPYTQLGCSIATVLAGLLAAGMRRWIFDGRIPRWIFGLLAGASAEVLDMLLIFATNMNDVAAAFAVVQACAVPMISLNGGACALAVALCRGADRRPQGKIAERPELADSFQRWLGAIMFGAFLAAVSFIWSLQTIVARSDTQSLLGRSLDGFLAAAQSTVQGEAVTDAVQIGRTLAGAGVQSQERVLSQIVRGSDVEQAQLLDSDGQVVASAGGDEDGPELLAADFRRMQTEIGSDENYDWVSDWSPEVMQNGISAIVHADSGYVAAHWGAAWVERKLDGVLQDQAQEFHVGGSSGIILAERSGAIISQMTGGGAGLMQDAVTQAPASPGPGEMFTAQVYDVASFCMYAESGKDIVFAWQPVQEAFFERNMNQYLVVLLELLIFVVLFFLVYVLVKYLVVDRIRRINGSLQAIVDGDLNVAVDERSSREFSSLSDDINATVSSLKDHIAAEAARIDEELEFARAVQISALPENFPEQDAFSLYAVMHAAREVGGDFYDFFMPDSRHIAMLIADVSGKGIPAAMFMMKAKTLLRDLVQRGHAPQEVLRLANNELCENNSKDMFVTAWLGVADLETGELRFACAGHNPPLIRDGSGSWTFLKRKGGFVLGGMPDMQYRLFELHLEPGSMLFLYTDGITEAIDRDQKEFGDERLRHVLDSLQDPDCRCVCAAVTQAVERFAADEPQFDDMTMLAFLYSGEDTGAIMKKMTLEPQSAQAARLADFVDEILGDGNVPAAVTARVAVAADEVFSNICRYSGAREVAVSCAVTDRTVRLEFRDDGAPYDPTVPRDVDVVSGADTRKPGGLGIFLVQNIMDNLSYSYADGQNVLKMEKTYSRLAPNGTNKE